MSNGTVKFFNNTKGFGFITPETGDKVSYDVEETPKGMNAINVKVV